MSYFELFDLEVSLKVEKNGLAKKYFELQKKCHPDFFTHASVEEQIEALEKSSAVNKAIKILQSTDETIKYVLQLKGLLVEEEKYKLSPDFLMEMLELNELLMDAKIEGDEKKLSAVSHQLSAKQNEIYEPVSEIVENYKEGITTKEELLQVKEYYFRKKYLRRILEGID